MKLLMMLIASVATSRRRARLYKRILVVFGAAMFTSLSAEMTPSCISYAIKWGGQYDGEDLCGSSDDPGCCIHFTDELDEFYCADSCGIEGYADVTIDSYGKGLPYTIYRDDVAIATGVSEYGLNGSMWFTDYDVVPGRMYKYEIKVRGEDVEHKFGSDFCDAGVTNRQEYTTGPMNVKCYFIYTAELEVNEVVFDENGGDREVGISIYKKTASDSIREERPHYWLSSDKEWLGVRDATQLDSERKFITISVDANETGSAREGIVTIGNDGFEWQIKVRQSSNASPTQDPDPVTSDPVTPVPVTPDLEPAAPCYEVLNASDVTAPYAAAKAVTLQGVVYDGCDVVGIVELKLGKVSKGKGKVSGSVTTLDGKKHMIKAHNLTGIDGAKPATVSLEVKNHGTMTVTIGGTQFAGSLGGWHVQSAVVGGNWSKGGAKVYVDATSASLPPGTREELFPDGEPVTASGGKWKFAKAAGVKWAKPKRGAALPEIYDAESGKGLVVDTSAGKTNLSGLKLTYTPKKGMFKGPFKVYALEGEGKAKKLKKYTVSVSGVVVDGIGYGTATCKNPAASWSVTVR